MPAKNDKWAEQSETRNSKGNTTALTDISVFSLYQNVCRSVLTDLKDEYGSRNVPLPIIFKRLSIKKADAFKILFVLRDAKKIEFHRIKGIKILDGGI